ncbi:DUF502 domain-containing protein [Chitinophaga sp. Cy-1792]|uniref:DUF502 domain-containing protein n=1 Tax=Chitinophaga sp. Cy-1792 TaxID=2608339 RepID=UPI00141E724D|nr:DUF502 domain-containing protein [Chitinophaga sp. Cy-1792]NIG54807.1 DUF502 domain-containing protein [Chitinophaga sp. Cy-1792]
MRKLWRYIKNTTASGMLLVISLFVLAFLVFRIIGFTRKIVTPIAHHFPLQIPGIGKETLVTILVLLILCFLAGLFMKTETAQRFNKWLENNILMHIPGYSYIRALSTDVLTSGHQSAWKPATILIDGNEVICFVIDETENYCSVFFPSAPSPTSGTVSARQKGDIRYLSASVAETIGIIRRSGQGAADILERIRPEGYIQPSSK